MKFTLRLSQIIRKGSRSLAVPILALSLYAALHFFTHGFYQMVSPFDTEALLNYEPNVAKEGDSNANEGFPNACPTCFGPGAERNKHLRPARSLIEYSDHRPALSFRWNGERWPVLLQVRTGGLPFSAVKFLNKFVSPADALFAFNLFAGTGSLLFLFLGTRARFGRRAAGIAALLAITSPLQIFFFPLWLDVQIVVLLFWLLFWILQFHRKWAGFAAGGILAILLFSKTASVIEIACLAFLVPKDFKRHWKYLVLGALALAAIALMPLLLAPANRFVDEFWNFHQYLKPLAFLETLAPLLIGIISPVPFFAPLGTQAFDRLWHSGNGALLNVAGLEFQFAVFGFALILILILERNRSRIPLLGILATIATGTALARTADSDYYDVVCYFMRGHLILLVLASLTLRKIVFRIRTANVAARFSWLRLIAALFAGFWLIQLSSWVTAYHRDYGRFLGPSLFTEELKLRLSGSSPTLVSACAWWSAGTLEFFSRETIWPVYVSPSALIDVKWPDGTFILFPIRCGSDAANTAIPVSSAIQSWDRSGLLARDLGSFRVSSFEEFRLFLLSRAKPTGAPAFNQSR